MISTLIAFLLLSDSVCFAQEQTGHGGHPVGVEVAAIITDILSQAHKRPEFSSFLQKHTLSEFEAAAGSIPIKPVWRLRLEGRTVAMKNFSDPARILVRKRSWKKIKSYPEKKKMVLHEVLGALEEEASETYARTFSMLPLVSCGISMSDSKLSNRALEILKIILLSKNYLPVTIHSDYQMKVTGNILWLKTADGKTIWSGDWLEGQGKEDAFPSSEYIPRCGS